MDWGLILSIASQAVGAIGTLARNAQAVQAQAELTALKQNAEKTATDIQRLQSEVQALQGRLVTVSQSIKTASIAQYAPYIALLFGVVVGWFIIQR